MAKLIMASSEPVKIIHLIEQMFPGVKLDAMAQMISGVDVTGTMTFTKQLTDNSSIILEVDITKG